jgi:prepilin-type processing-associated H-X9-DG protein
MYSGDFNGRLVPNDAVSTGEDGDSWMVGNARTMTNTYYIEIGYLYPYNRSPKIYVCPAETAVAMSTDTGNTPATPITPRVLTYSLMYNLGSTNVNYAAYNITSERQVTRNPGPAQTSVFWHEDARSIDNGAFGIWPYGNYSWWNIPANLHDRGCCMSFFDGHVEYWRWYGTAVLDAQVPQGGYFVNYPSDSIQDLQLPSGPTADERDLFRAQASVIPGIPHN